MAIPAPYHFKLRWANGSDVGFLCASPSDRVGTVPWSQQLYGTIPARLSSGAPEINTEANVTFASWDGLHGGGMGAYIATDFSRYRYARGVYAGDDNEYHLHAQHIPIGSHVDLSAATGSKVIRQILVWSVPAQQAPITPGAGTATGVNGTHHGQMPPGTYGYRVASISAAGESIPNATFSNTLPAGTAGGHYLSWPAVNGALGYAIYGRVGGNELLLDVVAGYPVKKSYAGWTYQYHDKGDRTPTSGSPRATHAPYTTSARTEIVVVYDDGNDTTLGRMGYTVDGSGSLVLNSQVELLPVNGNATSTFTGGLRTESAIQPLGYSGISGAFACVYRNRLILPAATYDRTTRPLMLYWNQPIVSNAVISEQLTNAPVATRSYNDSDRRLWLFNRNEAFWSSNPFATEPIWNGPIYVGSAEYDIIDAEAFGGHEAAPTQALYISKADGLFRILSTENGTEPYAEKVISLGPPHALNGCFLLQHQGELIVGVEDGVHRYSIGRADKIGPNDDQGLPPSLRPHLVNAASIGNHLVTLSNGAQSTRITSRGYQQLLETKTGDAWHQLMCSDAMFRGTLSGFPLGYTDPLVSGLPDEMGIPVTETYPVNKFLPNTSGYGTWYITFWQMVESGNNTIRATFPVRRNNANLIVIDYNTYDPDLIIDAPRIGDSYVIWHFDEDMQANADTNLHGDALCYVPASFLGGAYSYLLWSSGTNVYLQNYRSSSERLREATGFTGTRPIGHLEFPAFFAQRRAVQKLWHWVGAVQNTGIPVGQSRSEFAYRMVDIRALEAADDQLITFGYIQGDGSGTIYHTFGDPTFQRYLSGEGVGNVTSLGMRFRHVFTTDTGSVATPSGSITTPVWTSFIVAYSPSNQTLRRWTFNVIIARDQVNLAGISENSTRASVYAKIEQLRAFSANSGVIMLSPPLGEDPVPVRVDIGMIQPIKYDIDYDQAGQPFDDIESIFCQVICTELYAQDVLL
jgi:hypothetical protein